MFVLSATTILVAANRGDRCITEKTQDTLEAYVKSCVETAYTIWDYVTDREVELNGRDKEE